MLLYNYAAIDKNQKRIGGKIEANSELEALDALKKRQYVVLELYCLGEKSSIRSRIEEIWQNHLQRVSDHKLLLFTKELSMLLKAGIPFDRAFYTLAGYQEDEKMRKIVGEMRADLIKGLSISQSLGRYPHIFPPIFRAMVVVGEETGKLPHILEELSKYQEKELHTKKKIMAAMYYPLFVMSCTTLIIGTLMIFYLPTFTKFLDGLDVKLPIATMLLLVVVHIFQNPAVITVLVVAIAIGGFLYYNFTRTIVGKYFVDNLIINFPVLGELFTLVKLARFSRTFALMYKSGIQAERILETSKEIIQSEPLKDILDQVKNDIIAGESLTSSFSTKKYIPPLMKSFLSIGDETGDMVYPMEKISVIYDEQIANKVESFINLLEPVFMSIVAILVGFVVIALFLPIYSLISNLGG